MSEVGIIYKSILLYLLDRAGSPLPNSLISEFFVEGNYTDYFDVQDILSQLKEQALIEPRNTGNITAYSITSQGKNTLTFMMDRVGSQVEREVSDFLKKNDIAIRESTSLSAQYDRSVTGGYSVHLAAKDDDVVVMDLSLHVGSKAQAESICMAWKANHEKIYALLMENLM